MLTVLIPLFSFMNLCFALSIPLHFHDDQELVFTSILYRHGQRTPEMLYPKDPYRNPTLWPDGLGMLTNEGKRQQYELGKWLRGRYESLIPNGRYNKSIVYVQSTDVDRTLMSAQANLAGLFYPNTDEMWSDIKWQPIPVHTIPTNLDKMLSAQFPCPRIEEEDRLVNESKILKRYNEEHKELYKLLSKNTGSVIDQPRSLGEVYVNLLIESLLIKDFQLPEWAKDVYPDKLYGGGSFSFQLYTLTTTLKRLKGGPLLKEIITHMKEKKDGTLKPDRNLWIYSGHDLTVAMLLNTMGLFEPHMPDFTATIMIELRKNKRNEHFVSVFYKNNMEEPIVLTIKGCTPSCPLDTFEKLLSDVIPQDWEKECQRTK